MNECLATQPYFYGVFKKNRRPSKLGEGWGKLHFRIGNKYGGG